MERPIKRDPPVSLVSIRASCMYTPFYVNSYKKEFYSGIGKYPEKPFIVVD